ncbi:unnamed protein product [Rhizophagus irregularis]|nr:unnamed protein product [Rhizophagus irregularis]CAB5369087.1 unnamed protein product [Rhizophagus irregularis]
MFSLSISSKAVTKMIFLYKRSWEFLKRILRICENLECSLENEIIGSSLLRTLETLHHSQLNHNWAIYQQQFSRFITIGIILLQRVFSKDCRKLSILPKIS